MILIFVLFAISSLASASPTELKSGTGLFPRQDADFYRPRQPGPGPPSLFGWLGSRLARIPQLFRPRPAVYQNQNNRPPLQYESNLILPDPPSQELEESPDNVPEEPSDSQGDITPQAAIQVAQHQQPSAILPHSHQQIMNPSLQLPPRVTPVSPIQVIPSRMISYSTTQQQLPAAAGTPQQYPIPFPAGPNFFQMSQKSTQLAQPVVQTSGHTSTSQQNSFTRQHNHVHHQLGTQPSRNTLYQLPPQQGIGAELNYGATFQDIQQKSPVFEPEVLSSLGGSTIQSTGQLMHGFNGQLSLNPASFNNEVGTLLSTLDSTVQASQTKPVIDTTSTTLTHQRTLDSTEAGNGPPSNWATTTASPVVQILAKGTDGGNPFFELTVPADAPTFNDGNPFDINQLLAMLEPGAVIDSAEVSQASGSLSKDDTKIGPPKSTGTDDLLISESAPEPVYFNSIDTIRKPSFPILLPGNNSSSLKEIMQFFQKTDGKGHVIVERKLARPNETSGMTDSYQDLTDEFADDLTRINVTYERVPLQTTTQSSIVSTIQHPHTYIKQSPSPHDYGHVEQQANSTPQFPEPVFFAVKKTTMHPHHKYQFNSIRASVMPEISSQRSTTDLGSDSDMETDESQVQSVGITVTPPPSGRNKKPIRTTTTKSPDPVPMSSTLQSIGDLLLTRSPRQDDSRKRPSPVFRGRLKSF